MCFNSVHLFTLEWSALLEVFLASDMGHDDGEKVEGWRHRTGGRNHELSKHADHREGPCYINESTG